MYYYSKRDSGELTNWMNAGCGIASSLTLLLMLTADRMIGGPYLPNVANKIALPE